MRIKTREKEESFLKLFFKYIYNKKTKIIYKIIGISVILLIGIFVGLLASGFFGTIEEPSPKIVKLVQLLGLKDYDLQNIFQNALAENIKMPLNYLRGWFSKPEKIYIDIAFQDYEKLRYIREEALEKSMLLASDEDYVPATITHNNKQVRVWLRLKGDAKVHWVTDKWSLRIDIRGGDTLFGMRRFSIQHPKTRMWLHEFLYHEILRREDVLSLRYSFVDVYINGKYKGVYALEEHFDKYLIEYNNRREAPIIRFDEKFAFDILSQKNETERLNLNIREYFPMSSIDSFRTGQILEDPVTYAEFEKAKNLLEAWRLGKLKTSEVFDVDILAKYFAVNALIGAWHTTTWNNMRFYYNPVTSKLEPIGFDADPGGNNFEVMKLQTPRCIDTDIYDTDYKCSVQLNTIGVHYDLFFSDPVLFEKYIKELERVSEKSYLDSFFKDFDKEITRNLDIIHKDFPYYHFSEEVFYNNQEYIKTYLDPARTVNAYFEGSEGDVFLNVGNIGRLPVKVLGLTYNNSVDFEMWEKDVLLQPLHESKVFSYKELRFKIPSGFSWDDSLASGLSIKYKIFGMNKIKQEKIFPWSYFDESFLESDIIRKANKLPEFVEINESQKKIAIKSGFWTINESLTIPSGYDVSVGEGTTLDLINDAVILSYSGLNFYGTKEKPIRVITSDRRGQGLVVLNAPLSRFEYVEFKNLKAVDKDGWILTGAITFYDSDVKLENVVFSDINAEDSLNIVRGNFEIRNAEFENCFSDCFDTDFANGRIESSEFKNSGNDGLDLSGSLSDIKDVRIFNAGDKGISVGEKSNVTINNVRVNECFIGVASKDFSNVDIKNIEIIGCDYGFAVYQKKSEFGPASIAARNVILTENKKDYIVEKDSFLIIEDKIVLESKKNVYKELYPEEG